MNNFFTFSQNFKSLFFLLFVVSLFLEKNATAQDVPELIYYKFNQAGTTVTNEASAPVSPSGSVLGTASIGGTGQFGTALVGSGATSATNSVNVNWALNLSGPWTISMWFAGITNTVSSNYLFGGTGGSTFRAMTGTGLVSGGGNLLIRGTGLTDIPINGIFDASGTPVVVHVVYNPSVPATLVYVNGVYFSTVTQGAAVTLTGTAFHVGGYVGSNGLPAGGRMDEFRLYNRALTPQEITDTWDHELPLVQGTMDGGVSQLISPGGLFCANQQSVEVAVTNSGTAALTNFQVHWTLNGTPQTPYIYSGTLDPFGQGQHIDTILLGNAVLNDGNNIIKAWTVVTNDVDNTNDTLTTVVVPTDFSAITLTDTVCLGYHASVGLQPNTGYAQGMIQWQISNDGIIFNNIPNSDQPNWVEPGLTTDSWFRALINSGAGGCYSDTVQVIVTDKVPVVDLGNDTSICEGLFVVLDAGNPGSEYLWQDNSTNQTMIADTPGIYYVAVTNDAGCTVTDTIELLMENYPYGSFEMNQWPGLVNGTYTFVANVYNTTSLYWDFGDGSPAQTGNPVNYTYKTTGIYTASLHLENECGTKAVITKTRTVLVGLDDISKVDDVLFYPNPASSNVAMEYKGQQPVESVIIYDALGRIVERIDALDNKVNISVENWSNGIYSAAIHTKNGIINKKFTVNKQ